MDLSNKDRLILQRYFAGKPVKKAYLFSFYATNEANGNTDIDILVDLDYTKPIGIKFLRYHLELEELLHVKVNLVSEEGLPKYTSPKSKMEKVVIYERAGIDPGK